MHSICFKLHQAHTKPNTTNQRSDAWLMLIMWSVWVLAKTKTSFIQKHQSCWPYQQEKNAASHSWYPSNEIQSHTLLLSYFKSFALCEKAPSCDFPKALFCYCLITQNCEKINLQLYDYWGWVFFPEDVVSFVFISTKLLLTTSWGYYSHYSVPVHQIQQFSRKHVAPALSFIVFPSSKQGQRQ